MSTTSNEELKVATELNRRAEIVMLRGYLRDAIAWIPPEVTPDWALWEKAASEPEPEAAE